MSFINYRHEPVNFGDEGERLRERAQVIYCCSEKSVYDPLRGARVMAGPARQPLAAVLLDYDREDGSLYAVGTYGGEMFDKFFEEFSLRLALEHQTTDVRALVKETSQVVRLDEYCENQVLCG